MILRINFEHYLSHAIDYFTRDELLSFYNVIISAMIKFGGKASNTKKLAAFYPDMDTILLYDSTQDLIECERQYFDKLKAEDRPRMKYNGYRWVNHVIGDEIIKHLADHQHVLLICDKDEDWYMDFFCKYLKMQYKLDVFDLNTFFATGEATQISIDPDAVHKAKAEILRQATKEGMAEQSATEEGRLQLLAEMTTNQKLKKAKELGLKIRKSEMDEINSILIEAWVYGGNAQSF